MRWPERRSARGRGGQHGSQEGLSLQKGGGAGCSIYCVRYACCMLCCTLCTLCTLRPLSARLDGGEPLDLELSLDLLVLLGGRVALGQRDLGLLLGQRIGLLLGQRIGLLLVLNCPTVLTLHMASTILGSCGAAPRTSSMEVS